MQLTQAYSGKEPNVQWVNNKVQTHEGSHEILNPNYAKSAQEDMIAFLRVSMCASCMSSSRPLIPEAVSLLMKAAPKPGMNLGAGKDGNNESLIVILKFLYIK